MAAPWLGRGGTPGPTSHQHARLQLQDALKCQHCRKQFKSKAGLNYHTMAEHSTKVFPRAQLPSMLPTGRGSPSPHLPSSDHWPLTSTA